MASSFLNHNIKLTLKILKKDPSQRTPSNIETLLRATEHIPFFKDLVSKEKTLIPHIECCRRMTLVKYPRGGYVFEIGEPGDALYIILEGEVSVLIPEELDKLQDDRIMKRASVVWRRASLLSRKMARDLPATEIKVLNVGDCFGETALIQDQLRSASIFCKTNVKLAKLKKYDFEALFTAYENAYLEKIKFLKKFPFFKYWTKSSLQTLSLSMEEQEFMRGSSIYKEGDIPDKVYLIRSGQIRLTQKFTFKSDPTNEHQLNRVTNMKLVKKTELQIVIKEAHKMFGFEEIINEMEHRESNCVAQTDVSLYYISAEDFIKKVQNPTTKKSLEDQTKLRINWQRERVEKLKSVEQYKFKIAYPKKTGRKTVSLPPLITPRVEQKEYSTPVKERKLPRIFENLIKPRTQSKEKPVEEPSSIFPTELPLS